MRVPDAWLEKRPQLHPLHEWQGAPITVEDGVRLIGNLDIGAGTYIGGPAELNAKDSSIVIGDHCDIAANVTISTADSHLRTIGARDTTERKPIRIGNHVFIGDGAKVFGGCDIGDYTVIGANVVLKNAKILPYSLVKSAEPRIFQSYYAAPRMTCQDE